MSSGEERSSITLCLLLFSHYFIIVYFQLFLQSQNFPLFKKFLISLELILCGKDSYFHYTYLDDTCRQK